MTPKKLLSDYEELTLKRPLPSCPEGSKLERTTDGNEFFISASDKDFLNGLKMYKFTKDEINRNQNWFAAVR